MTRLAYHRFQADQVRLCLRVIAYNLGNLSRYLLLVAVGGELFDPSVVRHHAGEDYGSAVSGRLSRLLSTADFILKINAQLIINLIK
jgi:hypothetical protein